MTFNEALVIMESLIPAIIGGSIGLLAIVGIRELLKETKIAFNKSVKA